MPPIEFKQDPKTGEISIKEIQDESFVPHSDISKGRIWAHSSSINDLDFTKDPTILDKLKLDKHYLIYLIKQCLKSLLYKH